LDLKLYVGDLIFCADLYFLVFRHQALAPTARGRPMFRKK